MSRDFDHLSFRGFPTSLTVDPGARFLFAFGLFSILAHVCPAVGSCQLGADVFVWLPNQAYVGRMAHCVPNTHRRR